MRSPVSVTDCPLTKRPDCSLTSPCQSLATVSPSRRSLILKDSAFIIKAPGISLNFLLSSKQSIHWQAYLGIPIISSSPFSLSIAKHTLNLHRK